MGISRKRLRTATTHRAALDADTWRILVAKVFARDGYRCRNPYCRRAKPPLDPHHVIPRSQGGPDTLENVVTLCRSCHDAVTDARLRLTGTIEAEQHTFLFEDLRPRKTGW